MLGREVVTAADAAGHTVIERDVDSIDIVDPEFTTEVVTGDAPDAIINCAAFTDVDGAEDQEDVALEVNGAGAGNLAHAAAEFLRLVHDENPDARIFAKQQCGGGGTRERATDDDDVIVGREVMEPWSHRAQLSL